MPFAGDREPQVCELEDPARPPSLSHACPYYGISDGARTADHGPFRGPTGSHGRPKVISEFHVERRRARPFDFPIVRFQHGETNPRSFHVGVEPRRVDQRKMRLEPMDLRMRRPGYGGTARAARWRTPYAVQPCAARTSSMALRMWFQVSCFIISSFGNMQPSQQICWNFRVGSPFSSRIQKPA